MPFVAPTEAAPSLEASSSAEPEKKIGNVRVKHGAARFLAAGNGLSTTQGDIQINGFNAHMKFNKVDVQTQRAAGLNATRKVRMPFTKQLAQISNRAAAAAVPSSPEAGSFQPADTSSMTPDERRQRILRGILPAIHQRLVLIRLRQQRMLQSSQATQAGSNGSADTTACIKPGIGSGDSGPCAESEPSPSGVLGTDDKQPQDVDALKQENTRLRRMVRVLALAVRGLIRHSIKLRRRLARKKKQEFEKSSSSLGSSVGEDNPSSLSTASTPTDASSTESPQQLNVRRAILLRQYPRTGLE